ncbi:MAG: cadherin repeat domain-containing protein, partial [Moritella sp.]|uniref:cadherin repeat domain-containing protein n=1 Tax=Moritella sp. TaxID=78556 RepID=UPI0029B55054
MIVTTDRQTIPGLSDKPLIHNFTLGGLITNRVNDSSAIDPTLECGNNEIKDSNGNCIKYYADDVFDTYLYDYLADFGIRKGDIAPLCLVTDRSDFDCVIDHLLFAQAINFKSPLLINGDLICDFTARSVSASCVSEEVKYSTEIPETDKWQYEVIVRLDTLLLPPVVDESPGTSTFSGTVLKLAHMDSTEQTSFDWQDSITLAPNSRAKTSTLYSQACANTAAVISGECLKGSALFNPQTGFYVIASFESVMPTIQSGQSFSVAENSVIGDVFGQLQLHNTSLIEGLITTEAEITLVGDSAGAPFQISANGVLSIRDSSRVDYEKQQHYSLMASVKVGQNEGLTQHFDVYITNSNDNAPQLVSAIGDFAAEQGTQIDATDLSVHFTDIDGVGLKFSAENLPKGLLLNSAGLLTGTPLVGGEFIAQISVNDGQNFFQADITFSISEVSTESDKNNNSSGGTFYVSLLLLLLCSRRFR